MIISKYSAKFDIREYTVKGSWSYVESWNSSLVRGRVVFVSQMLVEDVEKACRGKLTMALNLVEKLWLQN